MNPRFTDRSGRVWVCRSVFNGRKVPGWHRVDPLLTPLRSRPSLLLKWRRINHRASDEFPSWWTGA